MAILHPSAILEIDGRRLSAAEAGLVRLALMLGHGAHDAAELVLWRDSKYAGTQPGARLSVALGEAGQELAVWAGEVSAVSGRAAAVGIEGLAGTAGLSRERKSNTYLKQTVADIVRDLAGSAAVDQIQADLELSAYSVDQRRPVWAHILDLARLTGSAVGCSAAGGLRFVPPQTGAPGITLRYGADVLAWDLAQAPAQEPVDVAAHGSASESGAEKWHWLAHDPAGSGGKPTRVCGAFHTRDAAGALAQSLQQAARRGAVRGRMTLTGQPGLRPGEIVAIDGLPDPNPGPFRVLEVRHAFDTVRGFLTETVVEGGSGQ